ncbi:MAG: winged helix-turn-helix transcriptional regulator [Candidatus Poseidoniales archaeon]
MGAKTKLLFLLVASFLGIGFALIPATEAEIQINELEHQNTEIINSLNMTVSNDFNEEIPHSLLVNIFSQDLQEYINLETSNLIFTMDPLETQNIYFPFTIQLSGNYLFNLTLLSNNDDTITKTYIEQEYTFYNHLQFELENTIVDHYLDDEDNANWIYNTETKNIELINLDEEYETGIITGPYNTNGNKNNKLIINHKFIATLDAKYTISYTIDFNQSQLYSTIWNEVYIVDENSNEYIEIEIEAGKEVYLCFSASDSNADEGDLWNIESIIYQYIPVKHNLETNIQEHYFFTLEETPEINLNIMNNGLFDQQLGNVTISVDLFSSNDKIGTYFRTPNIESGEIQTINFRFTEISIPGNYYCNVKITLINDNIYYEEINTFLSISRHNMDIVNPLISNSDKTNILIQTSDIESLDLENDYIIKPLVEDYFLLEISNSANDIFLNQTIRIISVIGMDQVKFSTSLGGNEELTDSIVWPSINFNSKKIYYAEFIINNDGFYNEDYEIDYSYSTTFVESIDGPNLVTINAGESLTVEIEIIPLKNIPEIGGNPLIIEISNNGIEKTEGYILSYKETEINIVSQDCSRHSLLTGQSIACTTTISNNGYASKNLEISIGIETDDGNKEIIDQITIDELDNQESWNIRTTYKPDEAGSFNLFINIESEGEYIAYGEMSKEINVIETVQETEETIPTINIPILSLRNMFVVLSIASIGFQFQRSENMKYLTFKFFIPLYSRLQKDTLADDPTRQNLLRIIYAEPGANFTQLKEKLGLHNGTLAHHLHILENHKTITSHTSGRQRLFFPFGSESRINISNSLITNITQKKIIKIVKTNPGITQSMISQQLKVSRQKVNYHVNSLVSNSILKIEKQGRITRLYPMHFT